VLDDYGTQGFDVLLVSYNPVYKDGDIAYMNSQDFDFILTLDPAYAALGVYTKNNYVPVNCVFDRDGHQRFWDNTISETELHDVVDELI